MKMNTKLREITKGYDVLRDSSTIAGVCMKIFRGMFLKDENGKDKKDHLSIVPEGGYERNDRQSKIALQYLQWRASKGEAIQHAGNGGEHIVQVGKHKYKLDGYIKAEKKAIEFLGSIQTSEKLKEVWECALESSSKANKQMAKEIEDQPDVGYLDPRQGYFGGRTGPQVLLTQASEGKRISMADIVSLYPYVNYKTQYPVGVPNIIIPEPLTEPWTKPEHISHKGLLKVEASGWPSNVKSDADKDQYIAAYKERYGISLNKAELDKGKNAGMRFISKLCLNSLWGKFSMRNELAKNEVVTNAGDFYEKLFDPTLDVRSIIPVTFGKTKSMRLVYKKKKDFIEEHSVSNVVISLWTTSAARLELYRHMRTVDDAPGCRLLYTDTDSVVYEHPEGFNPLKSGEFLGEMTMEYDDSRIQKWACGGPKQYAMELEKLDDGSIWHKIKVRGMTLDDRNSKELQFEKFWEMTENHGNGEKVTFYYPRKFGPTKESLVLAKDLYKDYGLKIVEIISLCIICKNSLG
ncbi:DNA polymerase type b, organellar and viral domain-containing protein [Ditylenchus destructor]|nr:DNA polymerase type b, organellar and viral domain-containing protein [Ditylenchus destructor]